jgi:hypothetical protein
MQTTVAVIGLYVHGECLWLLLEETEADLYGYGVCGFYWKKQRQFIIIIIIIFISINSVQSRMWKGQYKISSTEY